ncbi:MAG: hypothetical protein RIR62_1420 [Pseudomonadota bacterium]
MPRRGTAPLPLVPALLALLAATAATPVLAATSFDCVMDPARVIRLAAAAPGRIDKVEARRGQTVQEGDVIATLESSMERATLQVLELRAASTAAIDAQTARVAFARAQLERAEALERQQAQSQVKVEELRFGLALAESELKQSEVDRRALLAEAERARTALENTFIRAPISGVVLELGLSGGEFATTDKPVAILAQTDPIHVDAYLPAELHASVAAGSKVRVMPELPAGTVIEAEVLSVDPVFDAASRTFGLRVALDNPGNRIVAGQRCRIELAGP